MFFLFTYIVICFFSIYLIMCSKDSSAMLSYAQLFLMSGWVGGPISSAGRTAVGDQRWRTVACQATSLDRAPPRLDRIIWNSFVRKQKHWDKDGQHWHMNGTLVWWNKEVEWPMCTRRITQVCHVCSLDSIFSAVQIFGAWPVAQKWLSLKSVHEPIACAAPLLLFDSFQHFPTYSKKSIRSNVVILIRHSFLKFLSHSFLPFR